MKVWDFSISDVDCSPYYFPEQKEEELFCDLADKYLAEGKSILDIWKPLIVLKKEQCNDSDFFDINDLGVTLVNNRTAKWLESFLNPKDYELLPLLNDEEPLFVFNVIRSVDVLDKNNSEYTILPNGLVVDYEGLVFDPYLVENELIFRIPQLPYNIFCTGIFEFQYEQNKLNGLSFTDSEIIYVD